MNLHKLWWFSEHYMGYIRDYSTSICCDNYSSFWLLMKSPTYLVNLKILNILSNWPCQDFFHWNRIFSGGQLGLFNPYFTDHINLLILLIIYNISKRIILLKLFYNCITTTKNLGFSKAFRCFPLAQNMNWTLSKITNTKKTCYVPGLWRSLWVRIYKIT